MSTIVDLKNCLDALAESARSNAYNGDVTAANRDIGAHYRIASALALMQSTGDVFPVDDDALQEVEPRPCVDYIMRRTSAHDLRGDEYPLTLICSDVAFNRWFTGIRWCGVIGKQWLANGLSAALLDELGIDDEAEQGAGLWLLPGDFYMLGYWDHVNGMTWSAPVGNTDAYSRKSLREACAQLWADFVCANGVHDGRYFWTADDYEPRDVGRKSDSSTMAINDFQRGYGLIEFAAKEKAKSTPDAEPCDAFLDGLQAQVDKARAMADSLESMIRAKRKSKTS